MNLNYTCWASDKSSINQKSMQSEFETKKGGKLKSSNWLLMALLLVFSFSFAQTVTIGSGSDTNSNVPINYNWGYNYTQTIYTAAEMTTAGASATGTITTIRFKPTASVSTTLWKDWVVYLGNTSKDGFTTTTDWIALGSLTEVFNGTLIANTTANSWMEITLATPFNWTGGNLVVAIDENTASYGGNPSWASYTLAPTTGNKSIYYRSDGTNPSPSAPPTASGRSNTVGQIQLVFPSSTVPSCAIAHAPADLASGVARNASLSWATGGGGPTSYDVYFGTSASAPLVGNQAGATYTPATMAANTTYYWRVLPKNANGDAVGGCTERSFTTGTGFNYCTPSSTSSSTYINNFSTTLGTTNISNLSSGYTAGGYQNNYSGTAVTSYATGSFNYNFEIVGGSLGAAIWIDWNSNGTFETGERVFVTTSYESGPFSGSITVPPGTALGDYRMRTLVDWNASAPADPCITSNSRTETEDYKITVGNAPSCLAPTALASSAITASTATLSWTASTSTPTNGYDIYYSTTNTAPLSGTTPTVNNHTASPLNVTGLSSASTYYWWVRSDCGDTSLWAAGGSFVTTQVAATLPYSQDFSGTNGFSFVNGTQTNQWVNGSAAGNPGNSMYISNDAGVTNAYTTGTTSVTQSYRDITIPNGTTTATFSFDWKANGESSYDYLRVWLVPTSYIPAAGTQIFAGTGRIQLGTNFNQQTTWQTYSNATLDLSSFANATMRLVFEWRNDSSGGSQTPAAVDNISLSIPSCLAPTALVSSAVTAMTATLSWTASTSSPSNGYDIYYSTTNTAPLVGTTPTVNDNATATYNASGLSAASTYYWWVRSDCGSETSNWVSGGSFTTQCTSANVPFSQNFESAVVPALPICGAVQNVGTGNNWKTSTSTSYGFNSKVLNYSYNGSNAANTWYYTQGVNLTAGTVYRISYKYSSAGSTFVERMKVAYGTSPVNTAMTNLIADYPSIAVSSFVQEVQDFTAPSTGVFYFGFNAYSIADRNQLYVDDISIIVAPTDTPDYVNLQFPATATILAGGSATVYARVYEGGLTDTTSGQAPGILSWIGISPEGASASSNPNTWTTWVPATFNTETDGGSNDEYQANIGSTLAAGTYRYASRFQLNGGPYIYGGNPFNAWNGTDSNSGVLTVNANPTQCATLVAPANAATNVPKGTVALSWTAPATGPAPTAYKVYFGTTSGSLSLVSTTSNLNYNATAPAFSTTYYWRVTPTSVIGEGDAAGCVERSFTTEADPFAPYCSNVVYSSTVEPITKVTFAGIDNASSASTSGGASLENFIAISGNVVTGNTYTMTLKGNTDGDFTSYFSVYIDYNNDGDFDDLGESIAAGSITDTDGEDAITAVTSITIPSTAATGATRMRIKKLFNSSTLGACSGGGFGQTEDYTLNICTESNWYADLDGDSYGSDASLIRACISPGANYVSVGGDCNDANPAINPGATEICYDGIDQNCDGNTNDGCAVITATLRAENCGQSLTSLNQVVRGSLYSQAIPAGVTITGYRFKVTNLITLQERIVDRSNYVFQLTYTDFAEYNTPYSVEVALRLNQEWMTVYGAACTITTPGVPNTVLAPTSCGATLVQMNNIIRAVVVPSALNYEYNVALIEGGIPVATTTLVRSGESFNLLQLTGIPIKFGAEYSVTIRVEVPTSAGAQWSTVAGAACSVFTPLVQEAAIEGCGGEAGITSATMSTLIRATAIGGATNYRFTLTDGLSYTQVYTTPNRYFSLNNFNALSPLTAGGSYSVFVEVEVYGNYYEGKDCNILVPGGSGRPIEPITRTTVGSDNAMGEFKAIAYPNPFANNFAINLRSNNTSEVSLAIYDMTGRLLETRNIKADVLSNQAIGDRYPAGVYNVIVNQGENTQTIRVVKQ